MTAAFVLSTVVAQPSVASAAPTKSVIVKTQKQLNAALKDKGVNEIVLKTNKNLTAKISIGDYSDKTLTIAAPKATINNYGDFKKITLKDGKSFTDRGDGNNIFVKDENSLKLVTGKQSVGAKITVAARTSKITVVNNGEADSINIKAAETVVVRGIAKEAPAITVNAEGAKLTTAMDANVVVNKPSYLTVADGAELGSLKVNANADIKVADGASVEKVTVAKKASKVNLAADGSVGTVILDSKSTLLLNGDTKSTVAITSNVEGAKITTSVDADIVLNNKGTVVAKKGADIGSIHADADASITIGEGASAGKIIVAENAKDVAIKANGLVDDVSVDAKADVTLKGNTKNTINVTNNAEGASINSSVKTTMTLNANASVSLGKGAEGSSVKAGNESVTPTVDNKTDSSVTITDSNGKDTTIESGKSETITPDTKPSDGNSSSGGGSTGGSSSSGSGSGSSDSGSSGSGSSSNPDSSGSSGTDDSSSSSVENPLVVTVSAICGETTVYTDATAADAVLYSDYTLVADTNIEGCTYKWTLGPDVLSTDKTLKLDPWYIGNSICLTASTTVDGKVVTKTVDTPIIASMVQLATNKYSDVVVPYNTSIDDLAEYLPEGVDLLDEFGSYVINTSLEWDEVVYDPTAANQSFKFTAHATIPNGHRLIGSDEVTCMVTVLGENVLSYSASLLSAAGSDDAASLVDTAVANNEKVQLQSYDYDSVLTGNYLQLDSCVNGSSGLGYWIAVNVDFGDVDVSTDTTFGDGRIMEAIDENNQHCKPGATTSSAIVFVDIKALRDEDVTYYFRKGVEGDLTPITFRLEEPLLKVGELKTDIPVLGGLTVDSVDITNGMPTDLEYYLSGNSGDTISFEVEWYLDAPALRVGDNILIASPVYNYPVALNWPTVTITVGKSNAVTGPMDPSLDSLSITGNSVYIEPAKDMEYALTEKGASTDVLS